MRRFVLSTIVNEWLKRRAQQQLQTQVVRALRLAPRGGVANDSLLLSSVAVALTVEWHARDVHLWERDLSSECESEPINETLLNDTLTAIHQLFAYFPGADSLDVRVLTRRAPHELLLAGIVLRTDLDSVLRYASPAMRLKMLGIHAVWRDGNAVPPVAS
jgi:hypothetical protein